MAVHSAYIILVLTHVRLCLLWTSAIRTLLPDSSAASFLLYPPTRWHMYGYAAMHRYWERPHFHMKIHSTLELIIYIYNNSTQYYLHMGYLAICMCTSIYRFLIDKVSLSYCKFTLLNMDLKILPNSDIWLMWVD